MLCCTEAYIIFFSLFFYFYYSYFTNTKRIFTMFGVSTSILTPPKSITCKKMKDKIWRRIFIMIRIKVFRSTASSAGAEAGKNVRQEMVAGWRTSRKEIILGSKNITAWVFLDFVELNQFCEGTHLYSSRNRVWSPQIFLLIVLVHFGNGCVYGYVKPMLSLFAPAWSGT